MTETDIGSALATDLSNAMTDYSVEHEVTEAGEGQKEFRWQMSQWSKWLGYYKNIPELQTAIDAKATWTMGAGFKGANETVEIMLSMISGNGKDSFNNILSNMVRTYTIAGDAFAEIIRDKENNLVNLKPLDPSSIVIVHNNKGRIKRYEQTNKTKVLRKFKPDELFHLSRKRIADEIHGISVIPSVEWIILARNEAMADWKRVLHRNVSPLIIWKLDTDDTARINAFKTKTDAAVAMGENMYIPKGTVEPEVLSTAQNATLNPLNWIDRLNDYFFQAVNVPQIIIGNSKEFTDASGKIVYLSFEQSVKGEQLYVEEQVLSQLGQEISLTFPASLQQDAVSGDPSNTHLEFEAQEPAAQPNDTMAEMEGDT